MSPVLTGKVVRFDDVRGYGFVEPDEGNEDLFIHVNDLECDKRLIVPGVRVQFAAEEGQRGLKASRVSLAEQLAEVPAARVQPAAPAAPAAAVAAPAPAPAAVFDDDMACDVLTPQELGYELTEALLAGAPLLTGSQIVEVRRIVVELARRHCWIDE
ncbi:cold shock domain-containing protein [Amycolatopsis sp. NPDC051061]|uniref:cold-shock protein n=1 Tax=Amycolatopsis sp. NPDC051061 TaxID=3155042 RepID=UPI0034257064